VVKYWVAIERAVSLRSNDKVTWKAAMLSCKDEAAFPSQFEKCITLYGKRSGIVHGSRVLEAQEATSLTLETEMLSRTVLLSYLDLLEGLRAKNSYDLAGLKSEFAVLGEKFSKARKN